MTRWVAPVGAFLLVIAVSAFLINKHSTHAAELDKEVAWVKLQRDYLERVGWIRSNPDETSYKNEVNTFLMTYAKQVNEHLAKYNGNKEFDDYLQEIERKGAR